MKALTIAADMVYSQRNLQVALALGRDARRQREQMGPLAAHTELKADFVVLSQQLEIRRLGHLLTKFEAANDSAIVPTEPEPTAA